VIQPACVRRKINGTITKQLSATLDGDVGGGYTTHNVELKKVLVVAIAKQVCVVH
jgi:hypothetical protein